MFSVLILQRSLIPEHQVVRCMIVRRRAKSEHAIGSHHGRSTKNGLETGPLGCNTEPAWTSQPSLEIIRRICEGILLTPLEIEFLAQGAFNKIYTLKLANSDKSYIIRVSLPVHPHLKTESEAATLEWLKRETSIPVPRVIAMCSDSDNELGFEWMLMDHMPGTVLAEAWGCISWAEKENVTKRIAACIAQMNARKFKGIGSLFFRKPGFAADSPEHRSEPAELISMEMFWGNRIKQDRFRGPFKNSKDWLDARLNINFRDFKEKLGNESDDEEAEELEDALALTEDLQRSLPEFFAYKSNDEAETTSLCHDDLNMHNILVHEGKLSVILDWECTSALPNWMYHSIPKFLHAPLRRHFDRKNYAEDAENEPGSLMAGHRLEYEQTLLRDVFKAEMERLQPGWNAMYEQSPIKADFDQAVGMCDDMFRDAARNWLDKTRAGKQLRLHNKCDNERWQEEEGTA